MRAFQLGRKSADQSIADQRRQLRHEQEEEERIARQMVTAKTEEEKAAARDQMLEFVLRGPKRQ